MNTYRIRIKSAEAEQNPGSFGLFGRWQKLHASDPHGAAIKRVEAELEHMGYRLHHKGKFSYWKKK